MARKGRAGSSPAPGTQREVALQSPFFVNAMHQRGFFLHLCGRKPFPLSENCLPVTDKELIRACRRGDPRAQKALYDRYAPRMFGLCKRYLKTTEEAEDALLEGFFKVFTHLDQYDGSGNFEGWIRRIMVNQALMKIRKKHALKNAVEPDHTLKDQTISVQQKLEAEDILQLLNDLPEGYRTVFNLYVIEGYKHREIADLLGISINTSKSQLILARKKLRNLLEKRARSETGMKKYSP